MKTDRAEALKVFRESLHIKDGESFHLRFGPLDLFLKKEEVELTVHWTSSNDWLDQSFTYEYPFQGRLPESILSTERFTFSRDIPSLKIQPCLGELAFVAKPHEKLMILPGEKAKIFMSTPMSIAIIDEKTNQVITEIPVMDRAQTWFGETTTKGELCFFTRIFAALKEENLPFRPHRAMTHVHVMNRSRKTIPVERLRIPVPYFSLFQKENGRFVTSSLEVLCDIKGKVRDLKIRPPKTNIENLFKISSPRYNVSDSFFVTSVKELLR